MLFDGDAPHPVVVEGAQIEIPTALGVPLGFIVNELVTNAAKHAKGEITVRLETSPELGHCLSVSNGGPRLPDGFHLGSSKGLGLRIIQSLVKQINGRLRGRARPGTAGRLLQGVLPVDSRDVSRRMPSGCGRLMLGRIRRGSLRLAPIHDDDPNLVDVADGPCRIEQATRLVVGPCVLRARRRSVCETWPGVILCGRRRRDAGCHLRRSECEARRQAGNQCGRGSRDEWLVHFLPPSGIFKEIIE